MTKSKGLKPRWSAEHKARLRELWEAGVVVKRISRELGRNESSIENMARWLGLSLRYGPRRDFRVARLSLHIKPDRLDRVRREAYAQGIPISRYVSNLIANAFGEKP